MGLLVSLEKMGLLLNVNVCIYRQMGGQDGPDSWTGRLLNGTKYKMGPGFANQSLYVKIMCGLSVIVSQLQIEDGIFFVPLNVKTCFEFRQNCINYVISLTKIDA